MGVAGLIRSRYRTGTVTMMDAPPETDDSTARNARQRSRAPVEPAKLTWVDRAEAFVSRLSVRDNFWNSVTSFIFLPLAFFSGIRMKKLDDDSFLAVLPFKKFNKNWYHAMAGGALLANSEIAGGMYVFGRCGGDYTVVCKQLSYTFLRPCLGPAVYRMTPREDLTALLKAGGEFNLTLDLDISQQSLKAGERDRRVGRSEATFHVTPKSQFKRQVQKRKKK